MAIKRTHKEFLKILNSKNKDIEVLGEYKGSAEKIKVRCLKDGNIWSPEAGTLIRSKPQGCPKCAGNTSLTDKEFKKIIHSKHKNITIIGEYKNLTSRIFTQCDCGYTWEASPRRLLGDLNPCEACGNASKMNSVIFEFRMRRRTDIKAVEGFVESDIKILFECQKDGCKYKWRATPRTILNGRGCPVCAGTVVERGINDIWTTNPEIASLLRDKDEGYKISKGSAQKCVFVCPDCNQEKAMSVSNACRRGFSCNYCGDNYSYPNKFVLNVLIQAGLKPTIEYSKVNEKWCGKYKYDIYFELNGESFICENHGEHHYKEGKFSKKTSLKKIKQNDADKKELAISNGIKNENYIVLNCMVSDKEWIRNSIESSLLSSLINLEDVDWDEAHLKATKSVVVEINNLYNKGLETSEIAEMLMVDKSFVRKSLKKMYEVGKNDYLSETKIAERRTSWNKKLSDKKGNKIRHIESGMVFKNALECANHFKQFSVSYYYITNCYKGRVKKIKEGYTFEIVSDEENNK